MVTYGTPWLGVAFFGIIFFIGLLITFTRTDWKI
jgi:hypothetical protein